MTILLKSESINQTLYHYSNKLVFPEGIIFAYEREKIPIIIIQCENCEFV